MLECKVLEFDHGVSYGSVTLTSLQNDFVPELDLLVREAIQNSSDASLKEPDSNFKVSFRTGFFRPSDFNFFMAGLEDTLNSRYPESSMSFLEIRDTKTCGLTGHIRKADAGADEDHGNFFKLIFDTGKRQTQQGAGGNWGFGKSVYYRVGIGIVVFYSRVKTDNGYESRLIITVVEDETKKNPDGSYATMLHKLNSKSVGKAWWGIKDGEDLLPITDQDFIDAILKVFQLQPFDDEETGTSVIIPYINPEKLLEDIIPNETELPSGVMEQFTSVWGNDIETYLRLAIQRWYAPKIHNRELLKICDEKDKKKWLHVSVNGDPVRKQDMLPFFRLVQELYTSALAKIKKTEYTAQVDYEILTHPINIKNYFAGGTTAGYVAIAKVSKQQLYGNDMFLSPYVYCGRFEADGGKNEPMVMYTRDPGMVIEYSVSGLWVKGIPWPESEEDFVFGFFVPDTDKKLKSDLEVKEHAGKTLGEYLRSCEASDHMGWSDPAKMAIVTKIQKNTANQIAKVQTSADEKRVDATASRLSGKLGKLLMPRVGYAKGEKNRGGGSGSGGGTIKDLFFEVTEQRITGDELQLSFKIKMAHAKRKGTISLVIESEGGRIDSLGWQRDIGTPYPLSISELFLDTLRTHDTEEPAALDIRCSREAVKCEGEKISAEICREEGSSEFASFSVMSHVIAPEILGRLKITARDRRYSFSFKVV